MTIKDILLEHPGFHRGYQPQTVSLTSLNPVGCEFLYKLRQIPGKITAYFDRMKVAAVYKTIYGGLDDAYYIVVATDGTFFHVDY